MLLEDSTEPVGRLECTQASATMSVMVLYRTLDNDTGPVGRE